MSGVDVRVAIATPEIMPIVPGRLRAPLVHVVDKAMPNEWTAEIGQWLYEHRDLMRSQGDGAWRLAHDLFGLDAHAADLVATLRAALLKQLPDALAACGVADFDLTGIECHASLLHHRCRWEWGDGIGDDEALSRRIGFDLTLRSDPKMFAGGEIEFLDGTLIEPENGRLVWANTLQCRRVREVECWSQHPLHGRWSVWGFLHGPCPDGWREIVQRMRCAPDSG